MKKQHKHIKLLSLNTLFKSLAIGAIGLFLVACNEESAEKISEKIKSNKEEIKELQTENAELTKKLMAFGGKTIFEEPVSLQVIKEQRFEHHFTVSGDLEAVKQANISPEANGRIREILVDEGQEVKKGQLLAVLDHRVISNNIQEVESSLELATTVFQRQERLWEKKIGSEIQYLQAKNNKENLEQKLETLKSQLSMAKVKSPINGIIEKVYGKVGEFGSPNAPLIQVVNLNSFYLKADVSEYYLPIIKKGLDVEVSFPSFPGIVLNEKINRVGNVVSPANRSFEIELEFDNPEHLLKPNIIGEITINDYVNPKAMVVPTRIIRNDIKGAFIYVAKDVEGKDIAKKLYVATGPSDGKSTLIKEGLQLGDKVIIDGYANVSDGSPISIVKQD